VARPRIAALLRAGMVVAAFGVLGTVGCGDAGGSAGEPPVSEEETTGRSAGWREDEVVVASHVAYPPFEFSPRGRPKGFDIDLMDEVAKRADFEVRYENVAFEELIRGLDFELYDAAISAITINPGRERMADFSDPYYEKRAALVVRDGAEIGSAKDLAGRTVGVQLGTPAAQEASELFGPGDAPLLRIFPTAEDVFAALEEGTVDGVVHGLPAALKEIEAAGKGELEIVGTVPTGARYGIAFPEDSPLIGPVNEALAEMEEDGTYAEIYER
jgi:ABC-type amino acid transport substrate-binding protein